MITSRVREAGEAAGRWWADAWRWALMAAGTALGTYFILERGIVQSVTTALVVGILVIGVVITWSAPLAIPLIAMPALFVVHRVGFGGADLSASDVALAAAFASALLLGNRQYSRPVRLLLLMNLIYQFATIFTVIVNPQSANTFEWFHAWLLISGALVVGWALGRAGHARIAFLLLLGAGVVIAVGTIITGVVNYAHLNFDGVYPLWPWSMHKNFAGTAMVFAAIVAYLRPPWAQLSTSWMRLVFVVLVVAIVMTQSRQAMIGLAIVVVLSVLRRRTTGKPLWALLWIVPAAWLIFITVSEQIESQNQHNSYYQRLDWLREVYAFFKLSPIFGHGLRFWYYNPEVPYQPPQAEVEVAASAGIVGLIGFIAMWVGIVVVLWRVDPRYGTLALAVPLSRITMAQFDLFWIAAQTSIPFVVAGICLGALAKRTEESAESTLLRSSAEPIIRS